jgi:hypothetical protein
MPRPQRHPHYYVPPVLRFYTLLTAFLIAAGLVGLTEIGMRRLPHAAKSEHINPTDLSNALASQADHDSSSGILKRAPQTLIATPVSSLKPSVTVSVSTPSVISSASQPPQTTVGTVVSASNVPTTQPSVVTATPSSSGSASASSGLDSSLQTGLTLTSKVSTTHVTSVSSNLVTTNSNGQQTTIVTLVASTSTGVTAVETTVSTGKSTSENKKSIFTPLDTFVGNSYMVLVIAVVFKQFWSAIYGQAKLMEPFTMMNTEDGAPANRVMNLFYLSSSILPDAITAVMNGRWFILWNALVFMSVCALAPLGSEMLFLNTKYLECSAITDNINNPCWPPRLTIDPVIARAVQGLLTFIAMMTLTVMFLVNRMRTGIYADPSSIAAIAALTHHPEVLADFRALSDEATSKDIAEFISSKKYKLDDYMRPNGTWRFGIVPVNPTGQAGYRSVDAKRSAFDARPKSRRWKLWDTIFDVMFLFLLLALLGIVAGYYSTSGNDAYNRFFSTMTFGPRFVLTGTGTLIAVNWRRLERGMSFCLRSIQFPDSNCIVDSHTLSPFRRMAQTPSEPLSTILLRKSSIPLTAVLPMFFKGYYIASFIAFVAVVSEVLVIILGAVPYAPGQVYVELLVSAYMSMSLLGLMIIALITLMFWKHNLPDLPRAPDTVASMVTYVAESKMQEDFETAEWCDDRELSGRIVALGKRYVYGKQAGSDGEYRHLVDEEPTLVY